MSLPSLPDIHQLAPGLIRVLGQNPSSFTLQGTNMYLLHDGGSSQGMLIDTGSGKPEVPSLIQKAMQQHNISKLNKLILTHHHHDHIGGVDSMTDLVRQATIYKFPDSKSKASWVPLSKDQLFLLSGEEGAAASHLRVMHTPGHTPDSVCLLWYQGQQLQGIFTSDTVLGHGSSVFDDLSAYLSTLDALEQVLLDAAPARIPLYPGHGEVRPDGLETVRGYRRHRLEREQELLAQLSRAPGTLGELLERIYPGIPEQVVPAARRGLRLQLEKLVAENRVQLQPDGRYRVVGQEKL